MALDEGFSNEEGDRNDVYDGDEDVTVSNPIFDRTDANLIDGIVTECGTLEDEDMAEIVAELRTLAGWNADRRR